MKNRIFNLIILDESGSMESIKAAALNSINESLQSIRRAQATYENQEHYVSVITFNDEVRTLFDCVHVDTVNDLNLKSYNPDCCTALYDAMGRSLNRLRRNVNRGDKVLVTIITDGYENASKEYNAKSIKSLVENLKSKGWVFAYMGANQDAEQVGAALSIGNTLNFEATEYGTKEMSVKMKKGRDKMFCCIAKDDFSPDEANWNFFKDVGI